MPVNGSAWLKLKVTYKGQIAVSSVSRMWYLCKCWYCSFNSTGIIKTNNNSSENCDKLCWWFFADSISHGQNHWNDRQTISQLRRLLRLTSSLSPAGELLLTSVCHWGKANLSSTHWIHWKMWWLIYPYITVYGVTTDSYCLQFLGVREGPNWRAWPA